MSTRHPKRKPSFFWQGVLIVLPVVVLAVVGLVSLRQDKLLARHEAEVRAHALAHDLTEKVWQEIVLVPESERSRYPSFEVDHHGRLIFPPPVESVPRPRPLNPDELTEEQSRLWQSCQSSGNPADDLAAVAQACDQFLESKPTENFAAAAQFALGTLLAKQGQPMVAAERFDLILEKYPNAVGESGIPFQSLAQFKLLQLQSSLTNVTKLKHLPSLEAFYSNLVFHPTPLTPHLLSLKEPTQILRDPSQAGSIAQAAKVQPVRLKQGPLEVQPSFAPRTESSEDVRERWLRVWEEQESSRQLFEAAQSHLQTNPVISSAPSQIHSRGYVPSSLADRPLLMSTASQSRVSAPQLFWFKAGKTLLSRVTGDPRIISDRHWLASQSNSEGENCHIICRDETTIVPRLTQLVENTPQVPEYFGISLELAGRSIISSSNLPVLVEGSLGKAAGSGWKPAIHLAPPEILATSTKSEAGTPQLQLHVHLTSPQILFARQRERTVWFGLLISVSAAGALVGFVSAWRAFQKQQRLAEMKSNFVSSVSHELRAPIASVRLMAEGLQRGKVQDETKRQEYFRFIVQECRRLSSLIENVLDFSRIEQGRKQYDLEPTNMVSLVQGTAQLMQPQAAERQITISTSLPAETVIADVDGKALQQALVNLIDNAIKHSPSGSTVTVGLGSQASTVAACNSQLGDRIKLFVEDQGEGIPPDEHARIFERFYRLGSELRRETQGVGLGLAIVKHIAEAHGGSVTVQSQAGKGSRFTIELPVVKSEGAKTQSRT
jgi:signal transduction histidine kinase